MFVLQQHYVHSIFIIELLLLIAFCLCSTCCKSTTVSSMKNEEWNPKQFYTCIFFFFATIAIFLIKSHLGSWWILKFTGLCILKLLHIVSSWFKEDFAWHSKTIINHQVHNIICCKLVGWLITETMAHFWKWGVCIDQAGLANFFVHEVWHSICAASTYWYSI